MNPEVCSRFIDDLHPAFEANDPRAENKAAESANVRRVSEVYGAILRGDYVAFRAALSDDVELELSGAAGSSIAGRWSGLDQVVEATARNYAALEDQRPELLSVVAQGDCVAVIAR